MKRPLLSLSPSLLEQSWWGLSQSCLVNYSFKRLDGRNQKAAVSRAVNVSFEFL